MNHAAKHHKAQRAVTVQSPEQPLGKRHRYANGDVEEDLKRSARSIGFSKSEASELERLYQLIPKKEGS